jgi:ABC-type transport system involved in cytochrome bd biosynthesis fused ATPase/permease subunit
MVLVMMQKLIPPVHRIVVKLIVLPRMITYAIQSVMVMVVVLTFIHPVIANLIQLLYVLIAIIMETVAISKQTAVEQNQ